MKRKSYRLLSLLLAALLVICVLPAAVFATDPVNLTVAENLKMFKVNVAKVETADSGEKTLVITVNGTSVHNLFIGTYEEAVANGANKENWIKGVNIDDANDPNNGKPVFRIPITGNETVMPVVSISDKYVTGYENGENAIDRAFFARQFVLDLEANTIKVQDYSSSAALTVTNNLTKFKVSGAALTTVGGPNNNDYKVTLNLTMGSDSYDKAFIGRGSAASAEGAEVLDITDRKVDLKLKWMATAGDPSSIVNLMAEPVIVSFHSASSDKWFDRQFTISESAKTMVIDDAPAEETTNDPQPAEPEKPVKKEYTGTLLAIVKEDLESQFGMLTVQDGTTYTIEGDTVSIHFVPKNKTTYGWLHFGAISDASLTKDVTFNEDGSFDLTLSAADYCGYASPVAPLKKVDGVSTTGEQYYLAVPAIAVHSDAIALASVKDGNGGDVAITEELLLTGDAISKNTIVTLTEDLSSEDEVEILWQKELLAPPGATFPLTMDFTVSGLEAEQQIFVYHDDGTGWKLVGQGKNGKVTATLPSLSPVALAVSAPQAPQTGDADNAFLWGALMVCAAAAAAAVVFTRKRREE